MLHGLAVTLESVANLTLVIDDSVLKAARVRAVQEGTSVNAEVRGWLTEYAYPGQAQQALAALIEHARTASNTNA